MSVGKSLLVLIKKVGRHGRKAIGRGQQAGQEGNRQRTNRKGRIAIGRGKIGRAGWQ